MYNSECHVFGKGWNNRKGDADLFPLFRGTNNVALFTSPCSQLCTEEHFEHLLVNV